MDNLQGLLCIDLSGHMAKAIKRKALHDKKHRIQTSFKQTPANAQLQSFRNPLASNEMHAQDVLRGLSELREEQYRIYHLSSKEKEIANRVLDGETNETIARAMYMTQSNVKYHMRRILKKVGGSNRHELFAIVNNGMKQSQKVWRDKADLYG